MPVQINLLSNCIENLPISEDKAYIPQRNTPKGFPDGLVTILVQLS